MCIFNTVSEELIIESCKSNKKYPFETENKKPLKMV